MCKRLKSVCVGLAPNIHGATPPVDPENLLPRKLVKSKRNCGKGYFCGSDGLGLRSIRQGPTKDRPGGIITNLA